MATASMLELLQMAQERAKLTADTIHRFHPELTDTQIKSITECLEAVYARGYADGVAHCNNQLEKLIK